MYASFDEITLGDLELLDNAQIDGDKRIVLIGMER